MVSPGADRIERNTIAFPYTRISRKVWIEWQIGEFEYASAKYVENKEDHDASMKTEGVGPDSWWRDQLLSYVHRAHVLGLDTENGRQHLMKAQALMTGMVESMIRVYGCPPEPGHPSGEIVRWEREA